jgi:hypothetical protein
MTEYHPYLWEANNLLFHQLLREIGTTKIFGMNDGIDSNTGPLKYAAGVQITSLREFKGKI